MNTLTEIANLALVEIRRNTVKNLDIPVARPNASHPNRKAIELINAVFPSVLEEVQSASHWSSITDKETLSPISAPTDDDPVYTYVYPDGILETIKLVSGKAYEVVGKTLRTLDPEAVLWRVRLSNDPSQWNAHLTKAIYLELAARIAPALAEDNKIIDSTRAKADQALVDCTAKDFTTRSSPKQLDSYYGLNQARDGSEGRYPGSGDIRRLRGSYNDRINRGY